MTVKEQVLQLLCAAPARYLSGETLAARLGVTRAAVWKAVKALQAQGVAIEAVTNRGYRLVPGTDLLTADGIAALLKGPAAALRVEVAEELSSTNEALRARAVAGEAAGLVLVARRQTAGRGRRGQAFYSPADTGLYLSVLLRPALQGADAVLLTLAAATAAADAVAEVTGREAAIKWVNDLLLNGKKICGILTDAALSLEDGGLEYAICGVGINLAPPPSGFPPPLQAVAGALWPTAGAVPVGARCRLAAAFLNRLMLYCQSLPAPAFLPAYRRRLAWVGQPVQLTSGIGRTEGILLDVDERGCLLLRGANGALLTLPGGAAQLRPLAGDTPG